ncbi:Plasmodium exported protein, unknown function [Plasmodium gonderi]|uniref:Plasmodium RESA N-terminal domain-containing protein n=1 Tax=Plasmodium gonderi TaxID=77519 RepID=A0A1Y1JPQ0_PLAGO|nr:Plasmodium exported protein, unknown function [Plasmodium gonderi]GAW82044.1 Plasmodium exported protein, unknown function [Plasmodium gonderi]
MERKEFYNRKFCILLNTNRCLVSLYAIIFVLILNVLTLSCNVSAESQLSNRYPRNLSEFSGEESEDVRNYDLEGNPDDSMEEITDDLYDNTQENLNSTGDEVNELKEQCNVVFHGFSEEDINTIINSALGDIFKWEILNRWLQLHDDNRDKVDALKEFLSDYLEKLKSLYNVDENIAQEQMNKTNHTIDSTIRITEDYHNKLFFYYVIKDNLPEREHERFVNICKNTFTLFVNELSNNGQTKLNKSVIS